MWTWIIYAVIVLLWAWVLIPIWLRHRRYARADDADRKAFEALRGVRIADQSLGGPVRGEVRGLDQVAQAQIGEIVAQELERFDRRLMPTFPGAAKFALGVTVGALVPMAFQRVFPG